MKKFLLLVCSILCLCCFVACNNSPQVESYKLNENGNLIAIFDDGTTQDLGTLEDTISNGINDISVNEDNFYIINGILTDIKAKVPVSYELDCDGKLIVTYNDNTTKNLGDFENAAINVIDTISISEDGYYILNGVKTSIVATKVFNVCFNTGYSATVSEQKIKDGYKVELPELIRTGYTLDGWYCNGEKWSFNSDVVKNDMVLTAVWIANDYNVSFVTGISQTVKDMTITYDSSYALPVLSQPGYTFNGWEYQGRLVTAEKWNIAYNCELIASWTLNKYEITLDANGGTVETKKVLVEYGRAFTLPIATNEYGAFIGWFYGEQQITDENGNSLENWAYTENIELTTSWSIELSTVEDLQQLYIYPNAYFELKNTIDISANEWVPVGTGSKPFTGTINGCGNAINGLKITKLQNSLQFYGFIGKATLGKIYDITFSNINISLPAIQNTIYVGGVIGYNAGAEILNVITSGTVTIANHSSIYNSYAGGIIGYSLVDKVQNSTNNASVSAKTAAGGILGYKGITAEMTLFAGNSNNGEISGAKYAGGIIGEGVFCFAINCKNTGNVTGTKYVGGLFGKTVNLAMIEKSYNTGVITKNFHSSNSEDAAGGLIGAVAFTQAYEIATSIINSYNQGNIISDQTAGGIIGYCAPNIITTLKVQNCYNSGNVKGSYYVGGIVGMAAKTNILQCVNFGHLANGLVIATICYALPGYTTNIVDCYYNCDTANIDTIQGCKTTEKFAKTFYTERMFWSDSDWSFFEDKFPKLK